MITHGATHLGVATDHIIESFRNRLWRGYKTSAGVPRDLLAQFPILEESLTALGVVVWPMVEFEADDALAAAATKAAKDKSVEQVVICTPDKDLAQCVRGSRVVQLNRRTRAVLDEAAVTTKFGVPPSSIPDYLALVGDAADGYPGLQGVGCQVRCRRAGSIRPARSYPRRLEGVARQRREPRATGRNAGPRSEAGTSVSRPRDAPDRRPGLRHSRGLALDGTDRSV